MLLSVENILNASNFNSDFIILQFRQLAISPTYLCISVPFCYLSIFMNLPYYELAISSTCHFINLPFHQLAIS